MKQDTLEGKAKTKNGIKRLCFSIICILLEVIFIITIVTRLNDQYRVNEQNVTDAYYKLMRPEAQITHRLNNSQ